jgi:hypothetical protein
MKFTAVITAFAVCAAFAPPSDARASNPVASGADLGGSAREIFVSQAIENESSDGNHETLKARTHALGIDHEVDELGRIVKIYFTKLDRWVGYSYSNASVSSPLSSKTIGSISDPSLVQTKLSIRSGNDQQRKHSPEDEFEQQQRELLEMAIAMYSNPWNFESLGWFDYLSDLQKNDEHRKRCMDNCKDTCNAGGATMAMVCDAGAAMLAPATVGWSLAGIFGCATFGVWYAGKCMNDCEWRCR